MKLHIIALGLLLSRALCANIFVGSPFGGSHLHSILEISKILASVGHNITFVNLEEGALDSKSVFPGIETYTVKTNVIRKGSTQGYINTCITDTMKSEFSGSISSCMQFFIMILETNILVYGSDEIQSIFKSTSFDVILAESVNMEPLSVLGKHFNIPVAVYSPGHMLFKSVAKTNLPILMNSQPSLSFHNNFNKPPSFVDRFTGLVSTIRRVLALGSLYNDKDSLLEKYGISSYKEAAKSVQVFFTNDHPALSFPYLRPPSDIAIGGVSLLDSTLDVVALPEGIAAFIESAGERSVVYVSFGTYVGTDTYTWFNDMLDTFESMDLMAIVKVAKGSKVPKTDRMMPLEWVPQKDLLRSGKIKLFISHCGNNGRIEAIFFKVPALCIPLFAEQPVNAELVKWGGFGEVLDRNERESKEKFRALVEKMLENHTFYFENMKRASTIIQTEPGNVKEKMLFYIDYLAKYGNLDYLDNKVIQQQNIIEIYNLDIFIPAVLCFLLLIGLVFFISYLCCRKLKRTLTEKAAKAKKQ